MQDEATLVDHTIKIVLVGDSGVGKSSIVMRFTERKFDPSIACTIGVDFKLEMQDYSDANGKNLKVMLNLWDTAGQEKFQSLTPSYYRGAHVILLAYDITKRESFLHLPKWLDECDLYASSNVLKILVGDKIDLDDKKVSAEEAKDFARKNNLKFSLECSSKDGRGVDEIFTQLINAVLNDSALEAQTMTGAKKEEILIKEQSTNEASICDC